MATPIRLFAGQLAATTTTLATVPAGETWVLTHAVLMHVNANSAGQYVDALVNSDYIFYQIPVSSKDTVMLDTKIVLNAGDVLKGLCQTASTISVHINGVKL